MDTNIKVEALQLNDKLEGPAKIWVPAVIVAVRKTSKGVRFTVECQGSRFFTYEGSKSIRFP